MKFCRSILLFFFFVFLLPTFINAGEKECLAGGGCYYYGDKFYHGKFGKKKKCADGTCYAFYCIGPDGKVMEGIGCYEDFRGACSSLSAEVLEKAKGEKEYQYYYDENVMVVSCGYADVGIDCAYAELYRYKHQAIVDQTFGKNHTKLSGSKQCTYTTEVHGSATEPDKASNSNDVKLSGMFILGFVLFYLW